jgi:hypothetical protein
MFKKKIEHICNNCKLYDPQKSLCKIVVLHEGERTNVPVSPHDPCFYESVDGWEGESFVADVKEVKFWVENKEGQKTDGDGIVKMEYPEGFFGEEEE